MKNKILQIVNEQQSPLFRIMSVYDDNDPARRKFENNISATHIGNGFVLSVAHNIRHESQLIKSIDEKEFQNEIIKNSNPYEVALFNKCYQLDSQKNRRYINTTDEKDIASLVGAFKQINYDTRYVTLYSKDICKPFLIAQFKNNEFYSDPSVTALINQNHNFPEPELNVHTFIIELELIKTYWPEDISLYKVTNSTDQQIVDKLPSVNISFGLADIGESLYCLQASPSGSNLGRMINESRIEGFLDHHAVITTDRIGGDFILEGHRYLMKGYFRFGSSGAPYLVYDAENDTFMINAIQSEASPIQLAINDDIDGNYQYINAIASPLQIVQNDIDNIINNHL